MEVTFDGGKVITAHINGHIIRTDQPEKIGGTNTAPTPFDLFLAAIGTCAGRFSHYRYHPNRPQRYISLNHNPALRKRYKKHRHHNLHPRKDEV